MELYFPGMFTKDRATRNLWDIQTNEGGKKNGFRFTEAGEILQNIFSVVILLFSNSTWIYILLK